MFDEFIFQHLLSFVHDDLTLASLSCTCKLLRDLLRDKWGRWDDGSCVFRHGLPRHPEALGRAKALLAGDYRRRLLADLHAAQQQGLVLDGRAYGYDLSTLPWKWLGQVQLLATDVRAVVLYGGELEVLGALRFCDPEEATRPGQQQQQGLHMSSPCDMVLGKLAMLCYKCPLGYGLAFLEPPLRLGAADWQGRWREQQALGELSMGAPARLAGAQAPRAPVDDDVHLLRHMLLRQGVLQAWSQLAAPPWLLTAGLVSQVAAACPAQALRCLDVSGGAAALPDASLAQLLGLCPQLQVLRALGTSFGPACLAAVCGRGGASNAQQAPPAGATAAVQGTGQPLPSSAAPAEPPVHTSQHARRAAMAPQPPGPRHQPLQQPVPQPQPRSPLLPHLHTLDVSRCPALLGGAPGGRGAGTLLPRALCHLPSLRDLRASSVGGAGVVLDAAQHLGAAKGSSTSAAALLGVLGQLTRLELMDAGDACQVAVSGAGRGPPSSDKGSGCGSAGREEADGAQPGAGGLSWQHVQAIMALCTSLRRLALSSQQLAAECPPPALALCREPSRRAAQGGAGTPPDRGEPGMGRGPQHPERQREGSRTDAAIEQTLQPHGPAVQQGSALQQGREQQCRDEPRLPSLTHLEVGWGTGGAFLCRALQASPYLASLTVHAGAAVSNWHLQQLAAGCPHLHLLELRGANVSDRGLSHVLAGCPQLTTLRLYSCAGPVGDGLALALPPRPPAWRLRELALSWSNLQLTDKGLLGLLAPLVAALRCLVLRGCPGISDAGLWPALAHHRRTLECLELRDCGSLQRRRKVAALLGQVAGPGTLLPSLSPARDAGLFGAEEGADSLAECRGLGLPPLTAEAAVQALGQCQQLQALTVKGSVVGDKQTLVQLACQSTWVECAADLRD